MERSDSTESRDARDHSSTTNLSVYGSSSSRPATPSVSVPFSVAQVDIYHRRSGFSSLLFGFFLKAGRTARSRSTLRSQASLETDV